MITTPFHDQSYPKQRKMSNGMTTEEQALQVFKLITGKSPNDMKEATQLYRTMSMELHSDRTVGQPEDIRQQKEEQFKLLSNAKNTLQNYDSKSPGRSFEKTIMNDIRNFAVSETVQKIALAMFLETVLSMIMNLFQTTSGKRETEHEDIHPKRRKTRRNR